MDNLAFQKAEENDLQTILDCCQSAKWDTF